MLLWIRIQKSYMKKRTQKKHKKFFRDNSSSCKHTKIVTKRNWNILISQTFKQAEQMIEALREENSCDEYKCNQFILLSVLTHKKWSSRHVFFSMDITFYWHSYLLLDILLVVPSHCYVASNILTEYFFPFFTRSYFTIFGRIFF